MIVQLRRQNQTKKTGPSATNSQKADRKNLKAEYGCFQPKSSMKLQARITVGWRRECMRWNASQPEVAKLHFKEQHSEKRESSWSS